MKSFLAKICGAIGLGLIAIVLVVGCRIAWWQSRVHATYALAPDVRIICLGSSHTGCTWFEAPEFHNRVLWATSRSVLFSVMRLKELERVNDLSQVKYCFVDCDIPSITGLKEDLVGEQFVEELPVAWRHVECFRINPLKLWSRALINCGAHYALQGKPPEGENDRPWLSRTPEERQEHLKRVHGDCTLDLSSPPMMQNFREIAIDSYREIDSICKHHGIKLILFASPQATDNPARMYESRYKAIWDVIAEIKQGGFEYRDFRFDLPDAYFRDEGHLTRNSAYKFTEREVKTLLKEQ